MAEESGAATTPSRRSTDITKTGIEKDFSIRFDQPIPSLSNEFAKAYMAEEKRPRKEKAYYALLFDNSFPPSMDIINFIHNMPNESSIMLSVPVSGVIENEQTKINNFAVIMERPVAKTLFELFSGNPVPEKFLLQKIISPLSEILGTFSENRLMHGRINPRNIYFDMQTETITLGEPISEPVGFSQQALYEPLERALCHPLGKGDGNPTADFYALGTLIMFLILGKEPHEDIPEQDAINKRFEMGSFAFMTQGYKIPGFMLELFRGLFADLGSRRWGYLQVDNWIRKKTNTTGPAINREAMRGFTYNEKEYFSTRYVAHVFASDPVKVRQSLKIADLSRWLKHSVLKPELSEKFDSLSFVTKAAEGLSLTDDDIARIVTLLDPEGALRINQLAVNIYGMGEFLAYGFAKNNKEYIQYIGDLFNNGLLLFWLDAFYSPENEDDPRFQDLQWQPRKIAKLIKKTALGFGMERALYELNPSLPCQSPLVAGEYVDSLEKLLLALDKIAKEKYETTDPIDRHAAAFIATKIDLREEITLKKLTEFPHLAQNQHILMLALLLAAQTATKVKSLRGLSAWVSERMIMPLSLVKSQSIKDETTKNIRKAAREGNLQEIYRAITDLSYLKRDINGFKEAQKAYHQIEEQINLLNQQENNERMGYQYGLKAAVMVSYLVVSFTFLYMLTRL